MTPRFVSDSKARVWAVPVRLEEAPPKPRRAARAGFGERPGQVAEIAIGRRRVLLVRTDPAQPEAAGAMAAARLGAVEAIAIDARGWSAADAASFAAGAAMRACRYARHVTQPDPALERPVLGAVDVVVDSPRAARAAWRLIGPGVEGALFARDLVAMPSNLKTPAMLAGHLLALEAEGVEVEVLEGAALEGMGGLLAVGGGSANPPRLAVLRWRGRSGEGRGAPVLLVGKGITFDTGGVSIKPADKMWEMRADMAGAAACAGAMLALARRRSSAHVVAVLPLAENMVGARSYRPGDVLRMASGITVEVVDTDAEGRLVLADALDYGVDRFQPAAVVDLATLTGSIIVALGHAMAGMYASSDVLAAQVAAAGAAVGELAWRMPFGDAEALESDIADIRQCTEGRLQPDAGLAAVFLQRFVADGVPWAHLDIAGVEARAEACDRYAAGASGWGVRLLDRLVAGFEAAP